MKDIELNNKGRLNKYIGIEKTLIKDFLSF